MNNTKADLSARRGEYHTMKMYELFTATLIENKYKGDFHMNDHKCIQPPACLSTLTLPQLLNAREATQYLNTPEIPIVRGWIMDEIEHRNPSGFNAWIDQPIPEDADLRRFILS